MHERTRKLPNGYWGVVVDDSGTTFDPGFHTREEARAWLRDERRAGRLPGRVKGLRKAHYRYVGTKSETFHDESCGPIPKDLLDSRIEAAKQALQGPSDGGK